MQTLEKTYKFDELSDTTVDDSLDGEKYFYEDMEDFRIEICNASGNTLEKQWINLIEDITQEREDLGNEIYKDLDKEYYYLISDESVIQTLSEDYYKFDEDGGIIH